MLRYITWHVSQQPQLIEEIIANFKAFYKEKAYKTTGKNYLVNSNFTAKVVGVYFFLISSFHSYSVIVPL